jgi:nucleotide-binding universal stress UspA family protein
MSSQKSREIKRILVALDGSSTSRHVLETAAKLAAGYRAELVGLYVEDVNLIRMAELTFAQEVGMFSGTRRRLEVRQVERGFRGQARRVRQALETAAKRAHVDWSFRVGRGMIAAVLLSAAAEADLVILGRWSQSLAPRKRLGSTARSILAEGTQLTLLLQPPMQPGQPVTIIYDGSTNSQKALAVTARLMQDEGGFATVLILAGGTERAEMLQQQVAELSDRHELETKSRWLTNPTISRLAHFIKSRGFRLVVLSETNTLSRDAILSLLDEVDCPVLLVR